jgi:tRNA(fMet)-specific endonuclease VapC
VLDTDHLTELQYDARSSAALRLLDRLQASTDQDLATTIITFEEQVRGRLAEIQVRTSGVDQIPPYRQLGRLLDFYTRWTVLPFDREAAERFDELRRRKTKIGTLDLKIASIVLSLDATLL